MKLLIKNISDNGRVRWYFCDAHFSVFTPESLLLLLYNMTRASLLPFKCFEFYTTQPNTFEFDVVLQLEPSLSDELYGGL